MRAMEMIDRFQSGRLSLRLLIFTLWVVCQCKPGDSKEKLGSLASLTDNVGQQGDAQVQNSESTVSGGPVLFLLTRYLIQRTDAPDDLKIEYQLVTRQKHLRQISLGTWKFRAAFSKNLPKDLKGSWRVYSLLTLSELKKGTFDRVTVEGQEIVMEAQTGIFETDTDKMILSITLDPFNLYQENIPESDEFNSDLTIEHEQLPDVSEVIQLRFLQPKEADADKK